MSPGATGDDFPRKVKSAHPPRIESLCQCTPIRIRTPDWCLSVTVVRIRGSRGTTPFLDEAQIDAGADFEKDILNFLERAHELVVLLTPWALERTYVWAEIGAAWGRRIPIVALLLGLTPAELQSRPGVPVLLKKRDLLQLNEIDVYLEQLAARTRQQE